MPALRPSLNDFLVFRDKYRKEEDGDSKDIIKSWSHSKYVNVLLLVFLLI